MGTAAIHDIQGASHISPYAGSGGDGRIVTESPATAFTSRIRLPTPTSGRPRASSYSREAHRLWLSADEVEVTGLVTEFRPAALLSPTSRRPSSVSPAITLLSSGNPLPGAAGDRRGRPHQAPTMVIEDDAGGERRDRWHLRPGIRRHRLLREPRGHAAAAQNTVASGPTNNFGEISVLPDDGAGSERPHASRRHRGTPRRLQPGASHPRRRPRRDSRGWTRATTSRPTSSACSTTASGTSTCWLPLRPPAWRAA